MLALEAQIKKISAQATPTPQVPGWTNIPMTPVDSSFVMGVGAYKGKLLIEFHHDKGNIWGFDVHGQGSQFFTELMMAGSKGGWVWDKILGKPSEFGMAKGKFFAYPDKNGKMVFYTTPGAEFVHKYGRPTKFTYNPVGYLNSKTQYEITAKFGKEWKESLVRPSESRLPAEMKLLEQKQQKEKIGELRSGFERLQTIEQLRPLFEKQQKTKSFQELMTELDRLQKFDEIQRALKKQGIKKDLIRDILEDLLGSQLSLTPTIVPVIALTEDNWITKHGRHIWINNWYTPEELNKYDPKTGAGIVELEPWLRIDRSVAITEGLSMNIINRTLETFPLKLKNMINEFRVFNKITDHPSMMRSKGEVPESYKSIGWDRTFDQISGVYIPSENNAYVSINVSSNTIRHELGHAVWYGMKERDRSLWDDIYREARLILLDLAEEAWSMSRIKIGHAKEYYESKARGYEYEMNDPHELFAESFARYYGAKRPIWNWLTPQRQKQPYHRISKFFRERMKKYEK